MLGFGHLGEFALGEADGAPAFSIVAAAGAFTFTGQAAQSAVSMAAEVGAFTISGQTAALNLSMPAAVGSFAIAGQDSSSVLELRLVASATPAVRSRNWFTFAALGSVQLGSGGPSAPPTYAISGQALSFGLSMPAAAGSFLLSGQDARLEQGVVLDVEAGAFTIAGQDVNAALSMPAAVGSFALSGPGIEFTVRVPKIRAFPRGGRNTVSARPLGRDGIKIRAYGG